MQPRILRTPLPTRGVGRFRPGLRRSFRGFGALTDSEGMPILSDAHITALAISYGDNDIAARISRYCREAPCTLVQQQRLDELRADIKQKIEDGNKAKADGQTMAMVAAGLGLALGYFIFKR